MKKTLAVLCLVFVVSWVVATTTHAQSDSLRILSWNVQMLPNPAKMGTKGRRAHIIADKINASDYDVVVLQELFHARSRRILRKALREKYPYQTRVLNKRSLSLKTNGGVKIFSRYPITAAQEIRFTARKGIDRMARKGAVWANIRRGDKDVQIVGTHLQAWSTNEILYAQYQQIYEQLLKPNERDGVTQVICGDFNTLKQVPADIPKDIPAEMIAKLPRYAVMLETLQADDGDLCGEQQYTMDRPYNDLCKSRKQYRLVLDYMLLRAAPTTQLQRQVRIFRQQWHRAHQDLSDHYAIEGLLWDY